ncbi:hypothetical protein QCA50_020452 [Cerrena zonata]|uniref:Uncharacterized protein n=1 Tax=Cerrena zonata TaxID=2478898 RepID=A0AAW0FH26_9APHY
MSKYQRNQVEIITGYVMITDMNKQALERFEYKTSMSQLSESLPIAAEIEKTLPESELRLLWWPRETDVELHYQGFDIIQKRREYRAKTCTERLMMVTRMDFETYNGTQAQMTARTPVPSEEEETIAKPFFVCDVVGADPDSCQLEFVTIIDPDKMFDTFMTKEEEKMLSEEDGQDDDLTPEDVVDADIEAMRRFLEGREDIVLLEEASDDEEQEEEQEEQ